MSRWKYFGAVVAAYLTVGAGGFADVHDMRGDGGLRDHSLLLLGGEPCPGDVAPNGTVGFEDLIVVLAQWGPCPPPEQDCRADLDEDRQVGFNDLLIVLDNWGPCPE